MLSLIATPLVPSYMEIVPFVTGLTTLSLAYNSTSLEEKPKIGNNGEAFLLERRGCKLESKSNIKG